MKVLAYTSPARGHLFPLVPILDELALRGHSIAIRTLASEVPLMQQRGFAAAAISPRIEAMEHDDYLARTPQSSIKRAVAVFAARAEHEVEDLRAAIEAERPDAILVDAMTWGATAAAEAWGGPWAQWFPYPMPLPSPDVPPFGPGFRPAAGALGRARDRALGFASEKMWARGLPALNAARVELGLDPLASVFEQFDRADRLLVLTSAAFDYPSCPVPGNARYVGPRLDDPSWAEGWTSPWPADDRRPLVLVGLSSTYQDQLPMVCRVVEALGRLPVRALVTLGPAVTAGDLAPPDNVLVVASAPHGSILPHAAAVITHAGHGTAIKALAAGVPLVCLPMGRDQDDTAARVVLTGGGVRLKPSASVNSIAAATRDVLDGAHYRDAARAMARAIAAETQTDRAVAELEALATSREPALSTGP